MTELTERDFDLIEVALESAISATGSPMGPHDVMDELHREYRLALARVQATRSGQIACAACGRVGARGFETHPHTGKMVCSAKNACARRIGQ